MNATQFALIGFGPIATALTIFGFVVVRGTKVSEFRQSWINDQRNDLSKLRAASRQLARCTGGTGDAAWLAFDEAATRINLHENPAKSEWKDVLDAIAALRIDLRAQPRRAAFDVDVAAADIESKARLLLKAEWKRVRFGEAGYKTPILFAALMVFWPILPLVGYTLAHMFGLGHLLPAGLALNALLPDATK